MTHEEFLSAYKISEEDSTCVKTTQDNSEHYTLTLSGTGAVADMTTKTQPWKDNRENITNLVINEDITEIGVWALGQCNRISGILRFSDSLTTVAGEAFNSCYSLIGIDLNNTKTIVWFAFYGCKGLTGDLEIPEGVLSVGGWALSNCCLLNGTLTLPDSLLTIGKESFDYTGIVGELKLPNNLKSIADSGFYSCAGFTGNLIIPKSVSSIGDRLFGRCAGVESIQFSSGITSIGKNSIAVN